MSGLTVIELAAEIFCLCLLVRIAFRDFQTLKVSNRSNLLLLATYGVWLASRNFEAVETDLLVAALFFGIAFVMWLVKALGAGDVKLYFVLGLFLGVETAVVYVVALLFVSLIVLLALKVLKFGKTSEGGIGFKARLATFQDTGKLPYAVLMVLAAALPLCLRFFLLS